jgi:Tat protein translocase TatB subunit
MFGIGMPELLIILAVALIIIGPKKLPELAKTLGRTLGEFKRATNDLKESIQTETGLDDIGDEFKRVDRDLKDATPFADETPSPIGEAPDGGDVPDEPMSQVKEAFDALNTTSDTPPKTDHSIDGDANTQDKKTP